MNLALFDFDGTITTTDTFTPFMYQVIPKTRRILGGLSLSPIIAGYKLGMISSSFTRKSIIAVGLRGLLQSRLQLSGQQFARQIIPDLIRPEARDKILWHQQRDDKVVVVSASLDYYLQPWCEQNGCLLICNQLASHDGKLSGFYLQGDCSGEEKVRRIKQQFNLADFDEIYAYGDTEEDKPMLRLAQHKYYCWQKVELV